MIVTEDQGKPLATHLPLIFQKMVMIIILVDILPKSAMEDFNGAMCVDYIKALMLMFHHHGMKRKMLQLIRQFICMKQPY